MKTMNRTIYITQADMNRLRSLMESMKSSREDLKTLRAELDQARVVSPLDIPPDVITMNSTARFVDEADGDEHEMTLVYPRDAGAPGTVSILAPVGSALLGLRVGQQIDWTGPGGRALRLRVLAISYQPEAAREFHR